MNKFYRKTNEKIAKFMGAKGRIILTSTVVYDLPNKKTYKAVNLKYHKDWKWLMPVVERIEDLTMNHVDYEENYYHCSVEIVNKHCRIVDEDYTGEVHINQFGQSKIEAVYKAIDIFIDEYNTWLEKIKHMEQNIDHLYSLLIRVLNRLKTKQVPCDRKSDIRQKNNLLRKISAIEQKEK